MEDREVIVYVSNNCVDSNRVLSTLDELDVSYVKKNTSENKEFMKELQKQMIYSTPTIIFGATKILGFQKDRIRRFLG